MGASSLLSTELEGAGKRRYHAYRQSKEKIHTVRVQGEIVGEELCDVVRVEADGG